MSVTNDEVEVQDEAQEINPFFMNYDSTAGIQDFRPKVVTVDPKEDAVARFEGHKSETVIVDEIQKFLETQESTDQEPLPLSETVETQTEEKVSIPQPEVKKISQPKVKSITIPDAQS